MFNLTIKMMQSLDGYIAKSQCDDLSWGSSEDKKLYKQVSTEFGTVIIGKNTYLQMPKVAFKNRDTIVIVRDIEQFLEQNELQQLTIQNLNGAKFAENGNLIFVQGQPIQVIQFLESKGNDKALLVGGGIINNLFLQAKLVSQIQVTIAPKIFGSGVKIFGNDSLDLSLELQSFSKISDNELLLTYNVI